MSSNSKDSKATNSKNSIIKDANAKMEDGNSSTETLSAEERHTLKHTQRQEPQGEEQVYAHSVSSITVPSSIISTGSPHHSRAPDSSTNSTLIPVSRNNDSNLSISSNTNTLIIHHSVPDEPWSNRWLSSYTSASKSLRERSLQPTGTESAAFVTRVNSKLSETLASSSCFMGGTPLLTSSLLDSSNLGASGYGTKTQTSLYVPTRMTSSSLARTSPGKYSSNSTELLDIPSSYLDQSEVLKHLIQKDTKDTSKGYSTKGVHINSYGGSRSAGCSDQSNSSSISTISVSHADRGSMSGSSSEGSQHISTLDGDDADVSSLLHRLQPPPAYPSWQLDCSVDIKEPEAESWSDNKAILSKSQPDLTRVGTTKELTVAKEILSTRVLNILQDDDTPTSLKELVDILAHENSSLKLEVDLYHRKVSKLQRFELEMAKVEEQYEALVKLCERRESLERLARHKLHAEVRRLTDLNNELKDQLEHGNSSQAIVATPAKDSNSELIALKKELGKRDVFIAQLVSQNKELIATKERQEMELTAQRQTLNEQRAHIDILDSALTNAQTNVVKLEEEARKKQNVVEQAGQLKRLLLSIKMAADRREQSEKNLRQKLEMEILQLRSNAKMDQNSTDTSELRREIREREEKIMLLEGEVTKWEQRFLQESTMRQMAIEAASMPKDAKIAVLERNSHESERRIAQAKTDKIRHQEEIQNMSKKIAVLENRNRMLESYNAEREAMIRVLQKRMEEKDCISLNNSLSSTSANKVHSNPTQQQLVYQEVSSKHQHSASVGGALPLSGLSAVAPPRKDEELGQKVCQTPHNYKHPPALSHQPVMPNRFDPQQESHTTSESYCCYVNADNADGDSVLHEFSQNFFKQETGAKEETQSSVDKKPFIVQVRQMDQGQAVMRSTPAQPMPAPSATTVQNTNLLTCPASNPIGKSQSPSPVYANVIEIQTSRGAPPPYYSHHQVLKTSPQEQCAPAPLTSLVQPMASLQSQSQNHHQSATHLNNQPSSLASQQQTAVSQQQQPQTKPQSQPLPRPVAVCQQGHPPNAFCRTCLNVRRSHRQNAAAFVRRANSSGCQHNRRSAPSPASSGDSLNDAPSILERLKKEWEMGILGTPASKGESTQKADGSKTLPQPLGGSNFPLSLPKDEGLEEGNQIPVQKGAQKGSSALKKVSNDDVSDCEEDEPNNDMKTNGKKDVAHLDRALNRLSIKRSSNTKLLPKRASTEAPSSAPPSTSSLNLAEPSGGQTFLQDIISESSRNHNIVPITSQTVCELNARNQVPNIQQQQYFQSKQHQHIHYQHNFQHSQQQQDLNFIRDIRKEPIELMIFEDSDHLKQNLYNIQTSCETNQSS